MSLFGISTFDLRSVRIRPVLQDWMQGRSPHGHAAPCERQSACHPPWSAPLLACPYLPGRLPQHLAAATGAASCTASGWTGARSSWRAMRSCTPGSARDRGQSTCPLAPPVPHHPLLNVDLLLVRTRSQVWRHQRHQLKDTVCFMVEGAWALASMQPAERHGNDGSAAHTSEAQGLSAAMHL